MINLLRSNALIITTNVTFLSYFIIIIIWILKDSRWVGFYEEYNIII